MRIDPRFKWLFLIVLLLAFFLSIELMGMSFKLMGKGFAEALLEKTANPFVGLFVGILATTLVQSSSTTTTMTVGLVAGGALSLEGAVPIIMGANIGTSVTNTIVSLAQVNRKEEFRRAFAGATIHDFFNWLGVLILLPIEMAFGVLAKAGDAASVVLADVGGASLLNPVKTIIRPVADWVVELLGESGILVLIAAMLLLFYTLKKLVDILRSLLASRAEKMIHATLFRSPPAAMASGALITAAVQSSSITTSVAVPLVGAGVVTLEQVFPFTVGANIGTTVTAMLAAMQSGNQTAIAVAFAHLFFNVAAMVLIYIPPFVRWIPLKLARMMGDLGARSRVAAVAYMIVMFYVLPFCLLLLSGVLSPDPEPEAIPAPAAIEEALPEQIPEDSDV